MRPRLLRDHLDAVRRHALGTVDGLEESALRRPVLPSGWSALDMIKHLTYDEEKFWFSCVVAGDRTEIDRLDDLRGTTWTVPAEVTSESVIEDYRRSIEVSDAILDERPLDAAPAWWPPELFGDWRLDSLEEIIMHMIVEVACHAGHLDATRELLDGKQWLVLTD